MKILRKYVLIAGLSYFILMAGIYAGMWLPPQQFSRAASVLPVEAIFRILPVETLWKSARNGSLNPGDPAPDFELPLVHSTDKVRLSALRGRPVFLIFGSYT